MYRKYIDLLKTAICRVEPTCFGLAVANSSVRILRERVFCYELYHQVRLLTANDEASISIHGEIDKRGHRDYLGEDQVNPDFVIHCPGTNEHNILVIEVKGQIGAEANRKDFRKLLNFVRSHSYEAGASILYTHSFADLAESADEEIRALSREPGSDDIFILSMKTPKTQCEEHVLSSL